MKRDNEQEFWFVCLVSERPLQRLGYIADGSEARRLTNLRAATRT